MRPILVIAAAGGALSGVAALAQSEPAAPCCSVIAVQIDEAEPVGAIVTARDSRTGELVSFRVSIAEAAEIRLGQDVGVESGGTLATVGGVRAPVVAATPQLVARNPAAPGGAAASAATASPGIACTRLNANGRASGAAVLTVNVNGQDVGTFDGGVYSNLEDFMTPGPNTIRLTFSGPDEQVNGELRCLRPGQASSRNTILSLRPTADRLSAETQVNLQPR